MSRSELPPDVLDLIRRHVDSMSQVEVLLLLHRTKGRRWDAATVAQELRIDVAAAAAHLETLAKEGLATAEGSTPGTYRFDPATGDLERAVENLRAAYTTRPVTLVTALYSRPTRAVQSFADAFRVRPAGEK